MRDRTDFNDVPFLPAVLPFRSFFKTNESRHEQNRTKCNANLPSGVQVDGRARLVKINLANIVYSCRLGVVCWHLSLDRFSQINL